jgi:putative hydrolase of the HAD superfamily
VHHPKMILFDYGQTLIDEEHFNGVRGTRAVLQHAAENRYGRTAEQVQAEADRMISELSACRDTFPFPEIPQYPFQNYLYRSQGIRLSITPHETETIFWDAAAPGRPAPGIIELLSELKSRHIRTGVISNLSFSGQALTERINRLIPSHSFEFILASSEVMFRKPSRRIFELALEMAGLSAGEVWFCGDNPECDVLGAQETGMTAVWYTGCLQGQPEPPIGEFISISAWPQLIELLNRLA